jgi:hypothetical protein
MAHLLNSMEHTHDLSKALQPTGPDASSSPHAHNAHARAHGSTLGGGEASINSANNGENVRYSIMRLPRESPGDGHWQKTKRTGKGKVGAVVRLYFISFQFVRYCFFCCFSFDPW